MKRALTEIALYGESEKDARIALDALQEAREAFRAQVVDEEQSGLLRHWDAAYKALAAKRTAARPEGRAS